MKSGKFTQIYIHLVFAPKNRECLLIKRFRNEIFSYMSGILTNKGHKSIIINGMPDHIHVLYGLNPNISVSDTVRDLKRSSSLFINEKGFLPGKFSWQDGYGAFSYSHSQLNNVFKYIENQQEHHKKRSFKNEYLEFLNKFEIEFNEMFLYDFFDGIEDV